MLKRLARSAAKRGSVRASPSTDRSAIWTLRAAGRFSTRCSGRLAAGRRPASTGGEHAVAAAVHVAVLFLQELPLRGILWFNSHTFNLTEQDTALDARVNYYYAQELKQEMRPTNIIKLENSPDGLAPFTRKTICNKAVVPLNYQIAMMTGHTHRRGEHFWISNVAKEKPPRG